MLVSSSLDSARGRHSGVHVSVVDCTQTFLGAADPDVSEVGPSACESGGQTQDEPFVLHAAKVLSRAVTLSHLFCIQKQPTQWAHVIDVGEV
jgi:hypothetical protein